jgi:hypothetical protein
LSFVPTISRFLGIVISMYHNDHSPEHFHARCAGDEAIISIERPSLIDGSLSPRVLGLVLEWAARHQDELRLNWMLARNQRPLNQIAPLD